MVLSLSVRDRVHLPHVLLFTIPSPGLRSVEGDMLIQRGCPLHSCVRQSAYLLAVKALPLLSVEALVELFDERAVQEVDEGVANIARVLNKRNGYVGVNGQIEEIVLLALSLIEQVDQHLPGVLVRDVLYHQGGSSVFLDLNRGYGTLLMIML